MQLRRTLERFILIGEQRDYFLVPSVESVTI